jgi:TPP-dependent pyruvate/acetoin dehydrogenase alpha subunit
VTYRYRGHSVADAGLAYRTKEEIVAKQSNDPIARLRSTLREQGMGDDELDAIDKAVDERVAAAVAFADASPEPEVSELARSVYAPGSGGQFARMRPGSPFGEEELVFDAGLGS